MSRLGVVMHRLFAGLPAPERRVLQRSVGSAFSAQDVAASLLGRDLWYEPLAAFRDYLDTVGERPHLWSFEFGPSRMWDAARWNALSVTARVVRARGGSPDRRRVWTISPHAIACDGRKLRRALRELQDAGLCTAIGAEDCEFEPVATPQELATDLHLVEIVAHWLQMLDHGDRVLADRRPSGYDVHGFDGACARCRERWGQRPRTPAWVPPFHPGCRCFAQPRFAQ